MVNEWKMAAWDHELTGIWAEVRALLASDLPEAQRAIIQAVLDRIEVLRQEMQEG